MHPLEITEVKIRFNEPRVDDLIGWASCLVNGSLFLNNIMVKDGRDGVYLHFPKIANRPFFFFNPITSEALQAFNDAILPAIAEAREASHGKPSGQGANR